MTATLSTLAIYPVKGLSAHALEGADLIPGRGLPNDRRFALAHGASGFDMANPSWLPKAHFLQVARNPKLAQLHSRFDPETETLTLLRDGRQVARGRIGEPLGRDLITQFFAAFMDGDARGQPKLVEAADVMFSDVPDPWLSIINLDTVEELGTVARHGVDPARFRGNLMVTGWKPWSELDLVGKEIAVGDGGARLRVEEPIGRCAATTVNPETGERDLQTLRLLETAYGHTKCGVYVSVVSAGHVRPGDSLTIL